MHSLPRVKPDELDHFNAALDRIMAARPKLTDYAPTLKAGQHLHVCPCGDYLVCTREIDQCMVTEPFTCTSCGLEQQHDHIKAMADEDGRR